MLYFRIGFENGDSLETGFNGTLEEAKAYYLGHVFNLGAVDDDMQRCNSVEQLPTKVEHSGSSLYIMPDGVNLF